MYIGTKIKEFRKKRNVTQEELARHIGVSFQAVSKWENNISLPDITLLPLLANYFGVSIDALFDFHVQEAENAVRTIAEEAYRHREDNPAKSRKILEDGLKKYPDNAILLNNMLYVINYTEHPDETISVASALIEKSDDDAVRYDALRFLAYAYKAKGDLKSAEAAIGQIPELYFTKLTETAYLMDGKAKMTAAEKQKWISFDTLLQMMDKIAEVYEKDGAVDKAIAEIGNALLLIPILKNKAIWGRTFFGSI